MTQDPIRLAIVARDPLARAGLAALLGSMPACRVVAQTYRTEALAPAGGEDGIDLIVWDWGWEDEDDPGDHEPLPGPTIVLVSSDDQAMKAIGIGSRGVLRRDCDEELLAAAVQAVALGLIVVDPALTLVSNTRAAESPKVMNTDITAREAQVLALLAEGLTNKAIGQQLDISEHTVKFHVNAIMTKLSAQSRTEAVVNATRAGLLSL